MPVAEFDTPIYFQDQQHTATRQHARTGVVVDASCDVPNYFLADPDVNVIPIPIHIGNTIYIDKQDPEATARYMRENANGEGVTGKSIPLDSEQMRSFFIEYFALDYDSVYCLTITANRSAIYQNSNSASQAATSDIRNARIAANIHRPFQLRVIDTQNMLAGSGIPAVALFDMLHNHMHPKDIHDQLSHIIENTYTYYLPDNLKYSRTRAHARGDRSISLIHSMLGGILNIKPIIQGHRGNTSPVAKFKGRTEAWSKLFNFVIKRIDEGLHTPHLIISYAGALNDVERLPAFVQLRAYCEQHSVNLHLLTMSITGMMNIGPGGLTLAFSGKPHAATF